MGRKKSEGPTEVEILKAFWEGALEMLRELWEKVAVNRIGTLLMCWARCLGMDCELGVKLTGSR